MSSLSPDTLLKVIAEPTRLRIILMLQRYEELCVCHLQESLRLSQPKISRHLKPLRDNSLVSVRKDGQWVYYSINQALPGWAMNTIEAVAEGAATDKEFSLSVNLDTTSGCQP